MTISQIIDRGMLSIALSLMLANSIISTGVAQITGKNNCHREDRQESHTIKSTDLRVTRQQTKLTIKTRQKLIVFKDICDVQIDQSTTYSLTAYFSDIDYFLIHKSAYEEGDYTLVNGKTGAKTTLWSPPVFSPNRKYFTSMTIDEMNGNTSVYVYKIDSMGVKVEYQDSDKKWKPTNPMWHSNNTIEFTHTPATGKHLQVLLHKDGRHWTVKYPKVKPVTK
jgi:hypothetical protein